MNVVVLGAGRSGTSAAALLRREGHAVTVLDGDMPFPASPLPPSPFTFHLCVASPGIALDHPWQVAARAAGIPVVSELQLGASRFRGRMLAVTGSKGKSSVVTLVADGLSAAGLPAVPCGNYGTPLCEVALMEPPPAWAVVEVSSFQMETTDDFHPEASALLNLQDDHLDRHGSRAAYHALKLKLLEMSRQAFVPDDLATAPRVALARVASEDFRALFAGSYFDNPVLAANGALGAALMRAAGLDDAAIAAAFRGFAPLPHRMQFVADVRGIRCIDDSKATSLAALAAGVRMASFHLSPFSIRLIAGGLPKGDNPNSVIPLLRSTVKKVYLIGRCANQFSDAWRETVPCEVCGTLDRAVEAALRDACAGETVLLSPGTASFDQFKSYGERGDAFAALVKKEKENER